MADKPRYYLTTAIAYPNGAPHIGHAYEADRDRRDRALQAARRLRCLLPHRHRRARHQDAADRGAEGITPRATGRAQRAALPGLVERLQLLERRLHPHHRGAPSSLLAGDLGAHGGERRHLSVEIFRLVLGARRGLLRRERDHARRQGRSASARRARRSSGWRRRAISSSSPPIRTSCSISTRGVPDFVLPKERLNEVASFVARPAGSVDLAHDLRLGHPGAGPAAPMPSTSCMCGSTR